jgi:enoyl-CoA hydratase
VILTGAGEKAFVAGADIGVLAEMDPLSGVTVSRQGQGVFRSIERFPKPVLAAVGGYALGGGCELALACHMRIASANARFGLPEVGLGIIPGYGGTVRLARLVGLGRAVELTLTGRRIDADEAHRMGLVSRVCAREELMDTARELMGTVVSNAPIALEKAMESIYFAVDASTRAALDHESSLFGLLASTDDMREGMRAFLEKRSAEFENR